MMSRLVLAATVAMLMAPVAQARNMEDFMTVKELPGGQEFEVLNRPGAGPAHFWCAAGAHAQRELGLGPLARVYLVQGRAPSTMQPGWQAVTFTVNPMHAVVAMLPDGGASDLVLSLKKQGYALSTDSARQYCFDGPDIKLP